MQLANVKTPAPLAPARADIVSALKEASAQTGVDFDYLLKNAAAESSFDPTAHSAHSSARGLFQFLESTWLDTLDKHGAKHGLGKEAAAISRDAEGNAIVKDAGMRKQLLALREDPRVSALMAGEFTKDNRAVMEASLGRSVNNTELYMAHFLGATGASKLINQSAVHNTAPAASLFSQAARANDAVFNREGRALAFNEVKDNLSQRYSAQATMALEMLKLMSTALTDETTQRWKA